MDLKEYKTMYDAEESHWWFKGKRKIVFSQLNEYVDKKPGFKVLDIGCGTGIMMQNLMKFGDCFGIDFEVNAINFCLDRKLKNVALGSAMNIPFKDGSFDVVGIFDVLYHKGIKNDADVLKEVYRVLKPGGIIILTDSADMRLWSRHDIAAHARERYSKTKLSDKLNVAGFKIKKISYFNMFLYPFVLIVRKADNIINKNKPAATNISKAIWLLNYALYTILAFESFLIKRFSLPFGVSIIAIAKKD